MLRLHLLIDDDIGKRFIDYINEKYPEHTYGKRKMLVEEALTMLLDSKACPHNCPKWESWSKIPKTCPCEDSKWCRIFLNAKEVEQ